MVATTACAEMVEGQAARRLGHLLLLGLFTIACTIPIALLMGWWMRVLRPGRVGFDLLP